MAARTNRRATVPITTNVRVYKRRPRRGPKRTKTLVMLAELVRKLDRYAVEHDTTAAEIVQDWIELHCRRGAEVAPPAGDADAA